MSLPFNPWQGLIVIPAEIHGPSAKGIARLAVDTGATNTLVNGDFLTGLGFDPSQPAGHAQMTTATGVQVVPLIAVDKLVAFGLQQDDFSVICHTLPAGNVVDGVLGLDFFRGRRLTIDFRKSRIALK